MAMSACGIPGGRVNVPLGSPGGSVDLLQVAHRPAHRRRVNLDRLLDARVGGLARAGRT